MTVKLTNQVDYQRHKYHSLTIQYHFDSDDDYRAGCRNLSHCHQQFLAFQDYTHPDDHTRQTTKSLGVQVNVFANKLKVGLHRGHNQFVDVAYYGPYHQINSKHRIYIQ